MQNMKFQMPNLCLDIETGAYAIKIDPNLKDKTLLYFHVILNFSNLTLLQQQVQ